MNGSAREWWAEHLPWIVIALLGLWLPPAAYAVAVPRSWNDPVTVATVAELRLFQRHATAWRLLVLSRIVVLVQTLWIVLLNSRLNGFVPTLETRPVVEAAVGLAIASYVLVQVRGLYR
jgi:hypothetical protein